MSLAHLPHPPALPPSLPPGDLLESEQNASVALRKELADLERQVQALQGNNNTLEKQVGCFWDTGHLIPRSQSVEV